MSVRQAWNRTWNVNVVGAHIMTSTFLLLIRKSHDARVIFITSGLSSLEITQDLSDPRKLEGFTVCRSTKRALNMMMLQWWRELKPDGFKVWLLHRGL